MKRGFLFATKRLNAKMKKILNFHCKMLFASVNDRKFCFIRFIFSIYHVFSPFIKREKAIDFFYKYPHKLFYMNSRTFQTLLLVL